MKKILLACILFMYTFLQLSAQCPSPVTPGVSLTQSSSGAICLGTNVTFTANSVNGGTPVYEWTSSIHGILSATTATYSSATLIDGEVITVKMTSSLACAQPALALATATVSLKELVTPAINITSDKATICPGEVVHFTVTTSVNGGSAPNGPTYQWRKNQAVIPGATTSTYATVTAHQDTYDVVMTSGLSCVTSPSVTSNSVAITVTPIPVMAVTITADKTAMCPNTPVTFTATVTGSGATPAPSYEWFIIKSATGTVGISQGAASTSANTFTTSAFSATADKVYVSVKSNASCASTSTVNSNELTLSALDALTPGTIGSDQTICYNSLPVSITQLTAPTNNIGTPVYQWEVSAIATPGAYVTLPGATNATYTPPVPLTQDVYLRRIIMDPSMPAPCNIATSNAIHITVRPGLMAGVISQDEIICSGAAPEAITSTVLPTGGTGTYTYQWQQSVSGTFVNIPGATNQSYSPPALTITTLFRRVETSGSCGYVTSNVVTKTIVPPDVVTASINNPGQICISAPVLFTAATTNSGAGTLDYIWSLDGLTVGTNSPYYSYTSNSINDTGKKLHVKVITSADCNTGPAISNEITLDIVAATIPAVSITSSATSECTGLPISFSVSQTTGTGNAPTYQWYVKSFSGVSIPVGTGSLSYSSSTLKDGDEVYVEMTSNLPCGVGENPHTSNKINVKVLPVPSPVINPGDQTICVNESVIYTATIGTGTTVQWYKDGTAITGATNSTFAATQSGMYSIQEDNSICSVHSAVSPLTVDPCGAFSSSISGPNPITNGQQNAVYSVPNQTGFTYEWSITGGTIISGQNTNTVTVDWDASTGNTLARTTIPSYAISVTETNPDGQKKTTTATINTVATSIVQSLAQSGIKLFPNPTAAWFSIEMPESNVEVSYEILDLTGVLVASGSFTSTGSDQKIAADFGAGMYQVVLTYNDTVTTARLSKVQ